MLLALLTATTLLAREKDGSQYGVGLIANVPFPESEVTQVIQDVVQNGIIRGTKEYSKDEYVQGANAASSTRAFKEWTEGGKVFYKIREKAIDPRNFKDSGDVGTLAVRYVVQPQGEKNTIIRIDAVFVEEFRRISHPSNGSVESAEYKDIHDRLDALNLMKTETAEALQEKQEHQEAAQKKVDLESVATAPQPVATAQVTSDTATTEILPPDSGTKAAPPQSLEDHVKELKQQLERRVKTPGAPLKSAPFHTASVLKTLPPGSEVLIVILTPYWFGVETHDGQHGWMLRDDLEQLP
ncbi:MAG TPA: SH3 domain-containing protein [Candidatus Solibacter sp.]|nr:SH3 domain-containing protein [Candidatus Solibacter sp.]